MDGFVHKEKSPFKMLGLTFSCKLDWGSYIISIAKTAPKKIGALSCSMKFLSQNVVCLSLFYSYYFGRCSSELTQLVALPFSRCRSTCYFYRWHDFSDTILRCQKNFYVISFFPGTARLWNSLPIECFPFPYDLNFAFLKKQFSASFYLFFVKRMTFDTGFRSCNGLPIFSQVFHRLQHQCYNSHNCLHLLLLGSLRQFENLQHSSTF